MLPAQSYKWQYLEKKSWKSRGCTVSGRFVSPTFEHTELFNRSVGDTTDVVQKEMYTFDDKGGRSITLRPEGTVERCAAPSSMDFLGDALPVKAAYLLAAFRYEKPQAGRLREFHQFGVEMLGSPAAASDAEVISMVFHMFRELGIEAQLELNSIGCPTCLRQYQKALHDIFRSPRGTVRYL